MAKMDKNQRATTRVQWSIFALSIRFMWCASVGAMPYNNGLIAESLCQVEHNNRTYQMTERRIESSISLELKPSSISGPCKQIFDAPPSHRLYVRLHPVTVNGDKGKQDHSAMGGGSHNMNVGQKMRNTTSVASCPINIYQTSEKSIPPLRFDPCQMNGAETSQLLSAPLRIVWQHSHNWPEYRITVTAYGDGEVCEQEGKHPCLKIGQQKLICISEELLCDNVRHCPSGSLYDSDESVAACESMNMKKNQLLTFFRELMAKTYPSSFRPNEAVIGGDPVVIVDPTDAASGHRQTTSFSVTGNQYNKTIFVETVIDTSANIRKNFPRGLSKYGPWGYLMLGMLLCGGALLVCGLWECCCRKQKPVAILNAGSLETHQQVDVNTISNTYSAMQHQNRSDSMQAVINYDETEPPPSYAVLFPNQKDVDIYTPGTSLSE